jgi:hypothetical protein
MANQFETTVSRKPAPPVTHFQSARRSGKSLLIASEVKKFIAEGIGVWMIQYDGEAVKIVGVLDGVGEWPEEPSNPTFA